MTVMLTTRFNSSVTFIDISTIIDLSIIGFITSIAVTSVCTVETIDTLRIGFTRVTDTIYCGFDTFININTKVGNLSTAVVFLMFISRITYTFSGNAINTLEACRMSTSVCS